jgi:hypothetical protein
LRSRSALPGSASRSASRPVVHPGVYTSRSTFIEHFKDAVWFGAAFSAVGIIAAALLPGRTQTEPGLPLPVQSTELPVAGAAAGAPAA